MMRSSPCTTISKSRDARPNAHRQMPELCRPIVCTDVLNKVLPSCCCRKCAVHGFRQQPASITVSQVCVWGREGGGSRTSRSARQRVRKHVLRQIPRVVVVYMSLFASQPCLSQRASAHDGVPAKWLSVPFCLIARATDRLCTSTRSLSPSLMSRHQQEIGLRPSPRVEHVVPLHFFHACFWPSLLTRVSRPSLRPRGLLHNRSRSRYIRGARRTRPIRTPCCHRRLAPTIVCQRVLLACPRRLQPCM